MQLPLGMSRIVDGGKNITDYIQSTLLSESFSREGICSEQLCVFNGEGKESRCTHTVMTPKLLIQYVKRRT